MIRISYRIDGISVEEIINPFLTPITEEMFSSITEVYDIDAHRIYHGSAAQNFAKKVHKRHFLPEL